MPANGGSPRLFLQPFPPRSRSWTRRAATAAGGLAVDVSGEKQAQGEASAWMPGRDTCISRSVRSLPTFAVREPRQRTRDEKDSVPVSRQYVVLN